MWWRGGGGGNVDVPMIIKYFLRQRLIIVPLDGSKCGLQYFDLPVVLDME